MKSLTSLFILVLCAGCGSKPKQLSYYQEPNIDSGAVVILMPTRITTDIMDSTDFRNEYYRLIDSIKKKGWPVQPILIPLTNHSEIK